MTLAPLAEGQAVPATGRSIAQLQTRTAERRRMSGAWIIIAFAVLMFLAVVYGFYTQRGSGINQRPQ